MCNSACIVAEHGVQDGAFDLLKALLPDPDLIDQLDAGAQGLSLFICMDTIYVFLLR